MANTETLYLISTLSNLHDMFLLLSALFWVFIGVYVILFIVSKVDDNECLEIIKEKWKVFLIIFIAFIITVIANIIPAKNDFVFIYSGRRIYEETQKDSTIKNDDELRGKIIRILTEESIKLEKDSN